MWWAKLKAFGPLYVPKTVELRSFLYWILDFGFWVDFQVQARTWTCTHRTWHDYKLKFGLKLDNQSKTCAQRPWHKLYRLWLTHVRAQILSPWPTECASLMEQCFPIQISRVEGFSNFCFWRLCDSFCIGRAEAAKGLPEVFRVLDELLKNTPNSHMLAQFQNPENPNAHFRTTGEAHDQTLVPESFISSNLILKMRQ